MENAGRWRPLSQLIDRLTDRRGSEQSIESLRKVKRACKVGGDDTVSAVFDMLMEKLKDQHARTRLHALKAIGEIFSRSGAFRVLLAKDFSEFLEYAIGFKHSRPLPDPPQDAKALREQALEDLELWDAAYGTKLPQVNCFLGHMEDEYKKAGYFPMEALKEFVIRMGYSYLRNVLKFKFPELRQQQAQREAEAAAREARSREINAEKYAMIKEVYISTVAEIQTLLDEMEALFRLVEGRADPLPQAADDEDWEDVAPEAGASDDDSQILLSQTQAEASLHPAKSKGDVRSHHELVLQRDADPAVLETLQGSHKVLVNQHLPAVLEWLRVVVRVDIGEPGANENARRERILRAAISVRDRILDAKAHYEAVESQLQASKLQVSPRNEALIIKTTAGESGNVKASATAGSAIDGASQSRRLHQKAEPASSKKRSRPKGVIEEVFGSDSDEGGEGPQNVRQKSQPTSRAVPTAAEAPRFEDPTYRQPQNAAAAQKSPLKPESQMLISKDVPKSKLPEGLKKKLLQEAPALPHGTHLAYWDSDKASLLNNKGMEVYNHWGAVDENVQLPEHVISQFFTTRASYYDPTKKVPKGLKEEVGQPQATPPASPKKRAPKVTAIGLGPSVSNTLAQPTLALSKKAHLSLKPVGNLAGGESLLPPSRVPAGLSASPEEAVRCDQMQDSRDHQLREDPQLTADTVERPSTTTPAQSAKQQTGESSSRRRDEVDADKKQSQNLKPPGRRRNTERGTVKQRAADRAHNEAVLAMASGEEPEALGKGKKEGQKPKPTVRQRLAAKLLTGNAQDRLNSDIDAVESERTRDADSHRWVT